MLLIPVIALAVLAVAAAALVAVLVGVALAAVAYLGVLAHSYAAAYHTAALWTKVKVFSTVAGVPGGWEPYAPGLGRSIASICVNETSSPLWVVAETASGLKRVALPPGRGTVGLVWIGSKPSSSAVGPMHCIRSGLWSMGGVSTARTCSRPTSRSRRL